MSWYDEPAECQFCGEAIKEGEMFEIIDGEPAHEACAAEGE